MKSEIYFLVKCRAGKIARDAIREIECLGYLTFWIIFWSDFSHSFSYIFFRSAFFFEYFKLSHAHCTSRKYLDKYSQILSFIRDTYEIEAKLNNNKMLYC